MKTLILTIHIYADDTTICSRLNSKPGRSDKVNLATALEKNFKSMVNCGKKWFKNVIASKTKLLTLNHHR